MKKIFIVLLICLCLDAYLYGQAGSFINYSGYQLVYDDEFLSYTPTNFKTDATFRYGGSSGGIAYGNWHLDSITDWRNSDAIYDPNNISMPVSGVLRLIRNVISPIVTGPAVFPYADESAYGNDTAWHRTGGVNLNFNVGPFGIMEVLMTVPNTWSSFWIDNEQFSILPYEGEPYSWWQAVEAVITGSTYSYNGSEPFHGINPPTSLFPGDGISYFTSGNPWHRYSVVWTPEECRFYLDGYEIDPPTDYNTIRTNFSPIQLIIALEGNFWERTPGNLDTLDIYAVRVYSKNCGSDISQFPIVRDENAPKDEFYIAPDLYKGSTIVSSGNYEIDPINATVFEAEAITISPIFLADFTSPPTKLIPNDGILVPMVYGGYFEIIPVNCSDIQTGGRQDDLTRRKDSLQQNNQWSDNSSLKSINGNSILLSDQTAYNNSSLSNNNISGINLSSNSSTLISGVDNLKTLNESNPFPNYLPIQVFPNPAQDVINISYPCITGGQLVIILSDVSGRIRYSQNVDCNTGDYVTYTIDFSQYDPGVYYIDLTLNNQHTVKKIVKL